MVQDHQEVRKLINAVTIYRIVAAPLLLVLVVTGNEMLFQWLLLVSFFTDAVDGFLARKFRVTSLLGARLDSVGDDLTIAVAVIAFFVQFREFVFSQWMLITLMISLYVIQQTMAWIKFGMPSSFHTYLAKAAAVVQALFLLTAFFFPPPVRYLFFLVSILTILDLAEEIVITQVLDKHRTNVGWLVAVMRAKNRSGAVKS